MQECPLWYIQRLSLARLDNDAQGRRLLLGDLIGDDGTDREHEGASDGDDGGEDATALALFGLRAGSGNEEHAVVSWDSATDSSEPAVEPTS